MAFYPKDVMLRLTNLKTNEYAGLVGGRPYEPVEENPMIGFRGDSRYYDRRYQAGFALECQAVKKVRSEMGLKNLKVMVPSAAPSRRVAACRTRWPSTACAAAPTGWRCTSCV